MSLNIKNGTVLIGDTDMDYISFGKGKEALIMIPGVGDGLLTVKGTALFFSMAYKIYAKNYRVYVFSRKNKIEKGYSTRDMAKDQIEAMKKLGISKASFIGISQGGMITQYIAIDYPDYVNKLVLVVTLSKPNETIQKVISNWIEMAYSSNYKDILIGTSEKSYSESYLKRHRFLYPIMSRIRKPKDFTRFIIQAQSCIQHDAYNELDKIKCPTLIIGGDCDKVVSANASREMAEKIKDSKLIMYEGLGHATYEEAKDFNTQVLNFINTNN